VGWVFQASERKAPSNLFLEDGTGVAMLTLSEGQEEWLRGEVGAAKDLCVRVVGTADEELRRVREPGYTSCLVTFFYFHEEDMKKINILIVMAVRPCQQKVNDGACLAV
jgi:hypothetical protein